MSAVVHLDMIRVALVHAQRFHPGEPRATTIRHAIRGESPPGTDLLPTCWYNSAHFYTVPTGHRKAECFWCGRLQSEIESR